MSGDAELTTGNVITGVRNPLVKFLVGLFAAMCACLLPRLGAMLVPGGAVDMKFLTTDYLIAALMFSALVGIVIVILEFRKFVELKETFMAALGVPALIAGAFNSSTSATQIGQLTEKTSELSQALRTETGIPRTQTPIEIRPIEPPASPPIKGLLPSRFMVIVEAHAAEATLAQSSPRPSQYAIQAQQPNYVIVLDQATTKEAALKRAEDLRQKVPDAQAVQTSTGFLIIKGSAPQPESSAVLDAVRIKNELNLSPKLQQVK